MVLHNSSEKDSAELNLLAPSNLKAANHQQRDDEHPDVENNLTNTMNRCKVCHLLGSSACSRVRPTFTSTGTLKDNDQDRMRDID